MKYSGNCQNTSNIRFWSMQQISKTNIWPSWLHWSRLRARPSVHGRVSSHFRPRRRWHYTCHWQRCSGQGTSSQKPGSIIFQYLRYMRTLQRWPSSSMLTAVNHNAVRISDRSTPARGQMANLCEVGTLTNPLLQKCLSSMRNAWCLASFLSNCRSTHLSALPFRPELEAFSMCWNPRKKIL